jgi:hypothetical protein
MLRTPQQTERRKGAVLEACALDIPEFSEMVDETAA